MLKVQEYLQNNSIESLSQYGIEAKYHATKPYVILDYDQIASNPFKEEEIVKECRGLILRTDDHSIVVKSFNRFYNLNESSCTDKFNWNDFGTTEKVDGSLVRVRWYEDDFFVATRNSFADSICGESGKTWRELVLECLTDDQKQFIKISNRFTFIFEFCSIWNIVVVQHSEPKVVLLSAYDHDLEKEIDYWLILNLNDMRLDFNLPQYFTFSSLNEVEKYIDKLTEDKASDEGVVLRDCNNLRLKVKSKWYLQLHRLNNNGNIANLANIVPIIFSGEKEEVLSYFPYLQDRFAEVELQLGKLASDLYFAWEDCKDIEDQKEFALRITKEKPTPLSSILFRAKKAGKIQDKDFIAEEFCNSDALILKLLKGESNDG